MDLLEAKNSYIERSRQIFDTTEKLSKESYGLTEIFTKKKLKIAKGKLSNYYNWLKEYDAAYSENLILEGALYDLNIRNAKLKVLESSRLLFLSSLNGYEKELSNIEGSTNFKLSTGIAVAATIISIIGVSIA